MLSIIYTLVGRIRGGVFTRGVLFHIVVKPVLDPCQVGGLDWCLYSCCGCIPILLIPMEAVPDGTDACSVQAV